MAPEKDRTASDLVRQVVVLVALLAVLVVNWMANALPIGGRTTGEVSAAYPVLFTPAGYAFSIWGLIYLALLVYAVVGLLPSRRSSYLHRAVGWPFVLTCGFNIGWIFAWHNMLTWLSLLLMLGLLGTLIWIYLRLGVGRRHPDRLDVFTLFVPFSLYLGWITVATVANVTIALYAAGFRGLGVPEQYWAVLAVAAALAVGIAVALTRRDLVYSLVLIWAFIAIAVGQSGYPVIVGAAAIAAVLQAVAAGLALLRSTRTLPSSA